jgi:hypothetical protein
MVSKQKAGPFYAWKTALNFSKAQLEEDLMPED